MGTTLGFDVSRWQYPVDFPRAYSQGVRFSVLRATIGDYYTDPNFDEMWELSIASGALTSAYLVVAPAVINPDGSYRRITADAHIELFMNAVRNKVPTLGKWIIDSELSRGQSNSYITGVTHDVSTAVGGMLHNNPIIYTRQTWWDTYINAMPYWSQCDLWAARYAYGLTGPWSDGRFRFRDWADWKFWQFTDKGPGPMYGVTSANVDLDYFNGSEPELYEYAHASPPMTIDEKVAILWREAGLHGWNLER